MSVIIRLKNLPMTAGAPDVRAFFSGLKIPDGAVHIIGGDEGEVFVGFSSDEDARVAMTKNGGYIHDSEVCFGFSLHSISTPSRN
uniref:RRM domain-containing protein n=1 Tax=Caenorhabditis japonica TaxID=281687 RepID=A0A8R1I8A3_CAEJA